MKKVYQTEQRKQLISYLQKHNDKQFSIEELINAMDSESMPGKSTIYRLIKQLVEEGLVRRFAKDNSRHFLYQLVDGFQCHMHFHLQCTKCGVLVHLDDESSKSTEENIFDKVGFSVDIDKTIMFGKCSNCQSK
jgi:Fur family ferric uptake transcriptional regulator